MIPAAMLVLATVTVPPPISWVRTYNSPANHTDEAHLLALDSQSNVYVGGFSYSAATLDDYTLLSLRRLAEDEFGMDALVEVHTSDEMKRAVRCGAKLIGVNNRDLHTFEVSLGTSLSLAREAPVDALLISESGLHSSDDLQRLRAVGYHGFLIGETLMRAGDPKQTLQSFVGAALRGRPS